MVALRRTLSNSDYIYDLLGVGFGPSHLSLCALFSSAQQRGLWPERHLRVFEQNADFAWHPEMLLNSVRMQVSFLKDLVTLKDPTSPYSFTNYLHDCGRLEHFLNLRTFYPTRREYSDYFQWAATKLSAYVAYGRRVEALQPIVGESGKVRILRVRYQDRATGEVASAAARTVSLSLGGTPIIPSCVKRDALGPTFHTSGFLTSITAFKRAGSGRPYRFLVIGGGQSAAEVFRYLASEFPNARITLAHRGFALVPAESSPLANEIFNREAVDLFYGLSDAAKARVWSDLRTTNYGAVDAEDIQAISHMLYDQRVTGGDRLQLRRFASLVGCERAGEEVSASLQDMNTGAVTAEIFDAVVLATGYRYDHVDRLLGDCEPYIQRTSSGQLRVRRDYSLQTDGRMEAKILVSGATEHSHGLTSTLLSVLPYRAAEILDACLPAPQRDSGGFERFQTGKPRCRPSLLLSEPAS